MKKLLAISLLLGWGIFTIATNSSCSSTPATSTEPDTIHLAFLSQPVTFKAADVPDTSEIWLSCGCTFVLYQSQSGGDTLAFQVVDLDTLSMKKTPHHLQIEVKPGTPSGTYTAWYGFWAVDYLGGTDRDTLQVSAKF